MTTVERRCPNGHAVDPTAAFCTTCGAGLDVASTTGPVCPSGHPVAPDATFCTTCGAKVDGREASTLPPTVGFVAPPPVALATSWPPLVEPAGFSPPSYTASYGAGAATPSYPAQGYGPGGSAYAYQPPGPIPGIAIAAFLVSLVWLYAVTSVAAIVLGLLALRRMKARHERGRGLAIAAIVLGGIGVLLGVVILLAHS
jgi:hypothetical protein